MNGKRILAVFAHPDDETFRAGGTLALLNKLGFHVHLLTVTRGEGGTCGNPPLCTADELPLVRSQELRCACRALGLEPPIILSYPDGQLSSIEPAKVLADILEVIDRIQPQSIISFGKDGLSGHPDHIAIGQYALNAFYEHKLIRSFYALAVPKSIAEKLGMKQIYSLPDDRITHTIDVSKVWDAKLNAIRCHQTQIHASPILKMDQANQRMFLAEEHFHMVENRKNTSSKESNNNDILQELAE